jgi:hypothetical protein
MSTITEGLPRLRHYLNLLSHYHSYYTASKNYWRLPMATPLDPDELVSFKELLLANSIQNDAIVQLLIEEGITTQEKFFNKLKQVQAQYEAKKQ